MNIKMFYESIKGKKVVFCGFGLSHRALVTRFHENGCEVHVCDRRSVEELGEEAQTAQKNGIVFHFGENYLAYLSNADIIFRTPGMRFYLPELLEARRLLKTVTSEMEVFFDVCPCKIIAVTGSDGKTTTTTLISEMLKAQGHTVHLGGNIGRPLLPIAERINPQDFAVVELSSFQLISMRESPDIAVVTNVSPNHLDMHKDMQEYIDAKKNIFLHQNAFSKTVLNLDNEITASFKDEVRGKLQFFSRQSEVENGVFLKDDEIIYSCGEAQTKLMNTADIRLMGIHNAENYMAACTAVFGIVSPENMKKVAREFGGVPHRMEFVREVNGVKYYNDSIATSPTRTLAGLRSYPKKIILLAGGYDKKIPFEPMVQDVIENVKLLILTGATAPKIEAAVKSHPAFSESGIQIIHADDMESCVNAAYENADLGDIVALSPACASFDKYPNFEARGLHFKHIVNALRERK